MIQAHILQKCRLRQKHLTTEHWW